LNAAILTVGDELVSGYRLDTNSQSIAQRLGLLAIDVVALASVRDELEDIQRGLRCSLEAADIVIITGGLGPTEDDMTRQAVAAYFERGLMEDEDARRHIVDRFVHRGPIPDSNWGQALVPAGSEPIQNERGTAAGFYLQADDKHVFATPGIPYEMEGMLKGFILPRLREIVGDGWYIRQADVKVYGLPESEINDRLGPLMERGRNPLLGLLPHLGTITIDLVAAAETPEQAEELLETDRRALRERLGTHIISENGRDLPEVVADLLVEHDLSIATTEVGTGGVLVARLTEPPTNGRWFLQGTVVSVDSIESDLANETEAAYGLARQAKKATGADVGIGIGPLSVDENETSGRSTTGAHVVVSIGSREVCRWIQFSRGRQRVRRWIADATLNLLRLELLGRE